MKTRFLILIAFASLALWSCEDPDNTYKEPYYLTDNFCYMDANYTSVSQAIVHSPKGLTGDVDNVFTLPVKLREASKNDVTVVLEVSTDSDVLTPDCITVSPASFTIPAGETEKDVSVYISNYSTLQAVDDEVTATVQVVLADASIKCSEYNYMFTLTVNKEEYTVFKNEQPTEGEQVSNDERTTWVVTDLNNDEVTTVLTDNSTNTYLTGNPDVYYSIDLTKSCNVTGWAQRTSSSTYQFKTYTVEYSSDGTNWETIIDSYTISSVSSYTYFCFVGGVDCRYLRIYMTDANSTRYYPRACEAYVWVD